MRYCSACGALNDTDAKFCGKCGKQLGAVAAEPKVESVEEPVVEIAAEPVIEAVEEPVVVAAAEPVVETVAEPVAEIIETAPEESEIVAQAVVEGPAPVTMEEQTEEPVIEPVVEDNINAPADEPSAKETVDGENEDVLTGPGQKYNRPVKGRVFGIVSFVLSLDALMASWIPFFNIVAIIEAVVALIFCNISKKNTNFKLPRIGSVFAWISIGLSVVISVLAFIFLMLLVYLMIDCGAMNDIYKFFEMINETTLIG